MMRYVVIACCCLLLGSLQAQEWCWDDFYKTPPLNRTVRVQKNHAPYLVLTYNDKGALVFRKDDVFEAVEAWVYAPDLEHPVYHVQYGRASRYALSVSRLERLDRNCYRQVRHECPVWEVADIQRLLNYDDRAALFNDSSVCACVAAPQHRDTSQYRVYYDELGRVVRTEEHSSGQGAKAIILSAYHANGTALKTHLWMEPCPTLGAYEGPRRRCVYDSLGRLLSTEDYCKKGVRLGYQALTYKGPELVRLEEEQDHRRKTTLITHRHNGRRRTYDVEYRYLGWRKPRREVYRCTYQQQQLTTLRHVTQKAVTVYHLMWSEVRPANDVLPDCLIQPTAPLAN